MRRIRLAVLLAVGLTLAPIVAESQHAGKVYRIGCLLLPPLAEKPSVERQAFLQGLRDLGYSEGRNIIIEYQSAAWNRELLPDLAAELVTRKVDIILAAGPAVEFQADTLAELEWPRALVDEFGRRHETLVLRGGCRSS